MFKQKSLPLAMGAALLALGQAAMAQTVAPQAAPAVASPPTTAESTRSGPPVNPAMNPTATEASGIPVDGLYKPASYRLGQSAVSLRPTLGVAFGHNSNLRVTSNNPRSSNFLVLTPELLAQADYRGDRYSLGYRADVTRYASSPADDFENQELAATGMHNFGTRTGLNWRATYEDRFDPIGSTQRSSGGGVNAPDHWVGKRASATARYGAPGARGRFEFEAGYFDKEYQNNRATTAAADYESYNLSARLFTRVAPNTEIVTEYRRTTFDYRVDATNLDNVEQRVLVGALWRATARTSGQFKVGYLHKGFDQVRPSYSGVTWEGGVRWEPRTYSIVDLSTGRSAGDPSGTGTNYILSSFVTAGWTHRWKSYFSTRVNVRHAEDEYSGPGRRDRTNTLGIAAAYDVRRNVRASVGIERTVRNSNTAGFDYNRNIATARLEIGF